MQPLLAATAPRRAAAIATIVGVVLLASGLAPAAPAAQPFVPGSVTSRGVGLRIGGFTGGLEYALTFSIALARAQGAQGNAQSQVLDTGVFGLILSQPGTCTGTAPIPPEQVPRPLRVNSVGGAHSETNTFADGQILRGGSESVHADPKPQAHATTDVGELDLDPLISIDGLRSIADASIDVTKERRGSSATATVGSIDLGGGAVRLENVRWTVNKTTGTAKSSTGGFTVGRITIAGAEVPSVTPTDVEQAFAAMNLVLAPLGVAVDPPVFRTRKDGTLEVTSLVVRVGGSDQGNPLTGALMAELQPLRDAVYAAAQDGGCPLDPSYVNAVLTVFDILFASFTGSGGMSFEVGGARTIHDTTYYENPLGLPPVFEPAKAPPPPSVLPGQITSRRTGGTDPRVQAQPGQTGAVSSRCETTHPSGSPGCSKGRAVLAGGLSLLVAAALMGAEEYRSRRRRARAEA